MYIVEIIAKFFRNQKIEERFLQETFPEDDYEPCEHIYVAIDSTKDYFACSKCGNVIKNNQKTEKINIFKL